MQECIDFCEAHPQDFACPEGDTGCKLFINSQYSDLPGTRPVIPEELLAAGGTTASMKPGAAAPKGPPAIAVLNSKGKAGSKP